MSCTESTAHQSLVVRLPITESFRSALHVFLSMSGLSFKAVLRKEKHLEILNPGIEQEAAFSVQYLHMVR